MANLQDILIEGDTANLPINIENASINVYDSTKKYNGAALGIDANSGYLWITNPQGFHAKLSATTIGGVDKNFELPNASGTKNNILVVTVNGIAATNAAGNINLGGATGSFKSQDGKTVTVSNGIIKSII